MTELVKMFESGSVIPFPQFILKVYHSDMAVLLQCGNWLFIDTFINCAHRVCYICDTGQLCHNLDTVF